MQGSDALAAPGQISARRETTAACLAIGNELLSGKVTDLNLAHVVQDLRALGVPLVFAALIPDDFQAIADAVHYASARADVVITTGGVGPTHDDITMEAIARAFGRKLVRLPKVADAIRAWYGKHTNDDVLRMADVPEGAELIEEDGLFLPVVKVEKVHIFPGEPNHFRRKFDAWKTTLRQSPFHVARIYLDVDEGEIAQDLRAVEAAHGVAIGSYPKYDADAEQAGYRVLITIESKQAAPVAAAARDFVQRLKPGRLLRTEPGLGDKH